MFWLCFCGLNTNRQKLSYTKENLIVKPILHRGKICKKASLTIHFKHILGDKRQYSAIFILHLKHKSSYGRHKQ